MDRVEAGPKLDAWIAEYEMGWRRGYTTRLGDAWYRPGTGLDDWIAELPRWSTDFGAAVTLLDKYPLWRVACKGQWIFCQVLASGEMGSASADSAATAICWAIQDFHANMIAAGKM